MNLGALFDDHCFNPCFSGTRARTTMQYLSLYSTSGFNPCFSGTRARTQVDPDMPIYHFEFQSLLFWNSRPDGTPGGGGIHPRTVSILVFLELAPGPDVLR